MLTTNRIKRLKRYFYPLLLASSFVTSSQRSSVRRSTFQCMRQFVLAIFKRCVWHATRRPVGGELRGLSCVTEQFKCTSVLQRQAYSMDVSEACATAKLKVWRPNDLGNIATKTVNDMDVDDDRTGYACFSATQSPNVLRNRMQSSMHICLSGCQHKANYSCTYVACCVPLKAEK